MIVIDEENKDIRLDKFLSNAFNISRNKIIKGFVKVNGKEVKFSYKLNIGDEVEFEIPQDEDLEILPENIELSIIYEDDYIAVINKEYNMVVHPSNTHKEKTLLNALLFHFENLSDINEEGRGIVHRLDKDTSGILIIAKTNEAHIKLVEMFKNHEIQKTYITILKGKFNKNLIRYESYIGRSTKDRKKMSSNTNKGKLAISIFELLDSNDKYSLVKVNILTGRTHQIRVHAKELGYYIVGDSIYGKKSDIERQQLHSYRIKFKHPITNVDMDLVAEIPEDIKNNLAKMKLEVDYARI